jgi:hypothetical protein
MNKDLFFDQFLKFRDENQCQIHYPVWQPTCHACGIHKAFIYIYEEAVTENWGA